MGQSVEEGILIQVRPLDFVDKRDGKPVQGVKVVLGRPASRPEYDGEGFVPFDLTDMSSTGLKLVHKLQDEARDLYLQPVFVTCETIRTGKSTQYLPRSISVAA